MNNALDQIFLGFPLLEPTGDLGTLDDIFNGFPILISAIDQSVPPTKAIIFSPGDDYENISILTQIKWMDGGNSVECNVYFDTVNPPVALLDTVDETFYTFAEDLEYETEYFWRIDAVNNAGTTEGDVWSFTTKTPFFKDYHQLFEGAYSREWEFLVELDVYFIMKLAEGLGMEGKKIVRSSAVPVQGERIERLVHLCKHFGADTFYEGAAGRNYIDEGAFLKEGVRVEFQDYNHPIYSQLYGEFVSHLSVIDLLFNHGKESLSILTNQGRGRPSKP